MTSHDLLQESPRCSSFADDDDDENLLLTGKIGRKDVLDGLEAELLARGRPPRLLVLSRVYALTLHLVVFILLFLLLSRPTLDADIMPLNGRTWCKFSSRFDDISKW